MILDGLTNIEWLQKLHPGFAAAFQFLQRPGVEQLHEGRQELDGSRLFAVVIRSQGKGQKGTKLEVHRRYIDIQYSVTGFDLIGWKPTSTCRNPAQPFDDQKDIQFFLDAPDSWVLIPQGSFGIFHPQDAHAPMGADGPIHKVVVKVGVDWQ